MSLVSSLFSFRSFRSRLIVFLLGLLVPVLGGIFYYVNTNNTEYTEETINSHFPNPQIEPRLRVKGL